MLIGADVLLSFIQPTEVAVGAMTTEVALIGAPYFLYLLRKMK